MSDDLWHDVRDRSQLFAAYLITALIDGLYVVGWALIQAAVAWALARLPLGRLDAWVLLVLQAGFALMTVLPVLLVLTVDLTKATRRTWRTIRMPEGRPRARRMRT